MRLHEPTEKADPERAQDRLAPRGLPGGPARVPKGQAGQGESRRNARKTKARMHLKKEEVPPVPNTAKRWGDEHREVAPEEGWWWPGHERLRAMVAAE